jgi:hypothetical protein
MLQDIQEYEIFANDGRRTKVQATSREMALTAGKNIYGDKFLFVRRHTTPPNKVERFFIIWTLLAFGTVVLGAFLLLLYGAVDVFGL